MSPIDLSVEVRTHVAEAIESLALDPESYGYSISWSPVQHQGQTGLGWLILITCRSPLLGQPPLGELSTLLSQSVPSKSDIRGAVNTALTNLRNHAAKITRVGNGHAPLPGKVG
jgi:hypothetical protein